jgi:hypothetical protein
MRKLRAGVAALAVAAVAAAPAGIAAASNSHAGQHGNHCGLSHSKHTTKVGQACSKTSGKSGGH